MIGTASAAYQYEGAWDEGGKWFVLKFGANRR
jgi:beta-glucosidase/6-phospho-beta-glucosidase/beta-galactosidase